MLFPAIIIGNKTSLGLNVVDKDLTSALSDVLTNVRKWEENNS